MIPCRGLLADPGEHGGVQQGQQGKALHPGTHYLMSVSGELHLTSSLQDKLNQGMEITTRRHRLLYEHYITLYASGIQVIVTSIVIVEDLVSNLID